MKKKLISLLIVSLFVVPFLGLTYVNAGSDTTILGTQYIDGTEGDKIVLGDRDPRSMVTQIINVILTVLSIIAVVIVLLGGFKWMTAGGNEDKVSEAKKLLGAGVIGLVIILAAWGIATFVLEQLLSATTNN